MYHDGNVLPTPPVTRALNETVKKLKAAGHEIVEWKPDGHKYAGELLVSQASAY
jgi:amidase